MKKGFILIVSFIIIIPSLLLAADTTGNNPPPDTTGSNPPVDLNIKFENPFNVGDNLYDLAKAIVNNIILPIGGVLCVLAFIYAGFRYVTAQGNSTKITTAHNTLLYAVIGTAVLLGAWTI